MSPSVQWLHNGRKLHLQHGPIDLIIDITGDSLVAERAAYQRAIDRFRTVLTELVAELPALRTQTDNDCCRFEGSIANRMWKSASACEQACVATDALTETDSDDKPYSSRDPVSWRATTTPMIAVAGSVADEMLCAIAGNPDDAEHLNKVSVNNGGDIAFYLDHSAGYRVGVVANPAEARLTASLALSHADGIGGVATSGWRGRSFSLGIADSVTVLAVNAANADAAATVIANAVTFESLDDSPGNAGQSVFIERQPANELDSDSDLGNALVTTDVAHLPPILIERALNAGYEVAVRLEKEQMIAGACLFLQDSHRVVGDACEPIDRQLTDARTANGFVSADNSRIEQAAVQAANQASLRNPGQTAVPLNHQETRFQQEIE